MSGDLSGDLARQISTAVRQAAEIGTGAAIATAIHAIRPDDLEEFFHASLAAGVDATPLTVGLPASPGAASGRIAMTADEAMEAGDRGEDVILVRPETTPDDVLGMQASKGILTARGGMVSHAAVVARGWGIPAVVGAGELHIEDGVARLGDVELRSGDEITIDGSTGNVYLGAPRHVGRRGARRARDAARSGPTSSPPATCRCGPTPTPRATPRQGRILGAQGIGLCRTEHMFLAARPPADHAPLHPRRRRRRGAGRARRARGRPDRRLRVGARRDGRAAGHGPPARSAAARVPARHARPDQPARRAASSPTTSASSSPPCAACTRPTR